MQLPAKIEYAYKAVVELSLRYNGANPVQLNTISDSQGIPKKFLIQLLLRLKNSGIVSTARGAQGGYFLTRPPSQISLVDVFRAIDDSILGNAKKAGTAKANDAGKLLSRIWSDITKETASKLSAVTFDKLIAQLKNEQLTYYI